MKKRTPPLITKLAPAKQRRMDKLLELNSEGGITSKEKAELKRLVAEAERLMVANAKRLASYAKGRGSASPAVPVTVWVQPEPSGR